MTINIDKEVALNFEFSEDEYIEKVILAAMDYAKCPYEAEYFIRLFLEIIYNFNFRNLQDTYSA
jgi:hypothetical protein